ncbi:MAG: Maf family protein [Vicinamibacterales bacterium]
MDRLILASASPRRAALLRAAGFAFEIIAAEIDDRIDVEETPDGYVRRMALTKVDAVMPRAEGRPVLAAETVIIADGRILGAPSDADDACRMLRLLSGREHIVTTAVCLAFRAGDSWQTRTRVERTTVEFAPLSEADIDWYVKSEEPLGRAGAYAADGLASRFVTRVHGSHSNVLGLPVAAVYELCTAAGLRVCT